MHRKNKQIVYLQNCRLSQIELEETMDKRPMGYIPGKGNVKKLPCKTKIND